VGLVVAAQRCCSSKVVVVAVSKDRGAAPPDHQPRTSAICWRWRPNSWRELRIFKARDWCLLLACVNTLCPHPQSRRFGAPAYWLVADATNALPYTEPHCQMSLISAVVDNHDWLFAWFAAEVKSEEMQSKLQCGVTSGGAALQCRSSGVIRAPSLGCQDG